MTSNNDRCPYCVANDEFRPMTAVAQGRMICDNCGHIAFPHDRAFRCPCQKCLKINSSPWVRRVRPQ